MDLVLKDLKCPFCHDPVKIKLADDAPSEPFEPWPGFISYPETHIQCWFCKQFNVLVKNQADEFQVVNIRHAQVKAQYDRAVEKIYDQMAEVEQKLEGQWGSEKQREAAQSKIDTLDDKLETGWGTEAQREKAQAQIVELQAKLDAPWGTEKQREAAALKLEKLEHNLQDRMNGFDNQQEKVEDRMEKVQARREAKYGSAAVVGAVVDAVFSGGKKSGCILPVLVIPLLLFIAVGALASTGEPDTAQVAPTSAVLASCADSLPVDGVHPEVGIGTIMEPRKAHTGDAIKVGTAWWEKLVFMLVGALLTYFVQRVLDHKKAAAAPQVSFEVAVAERQVTACSEAWVRLVEVVDLWEKDEHIYVNDFFRKNHKWYVTNWMFLPKKFTTNWPVISREVDKIVTYLHQIGKGQKPQRTEKEIFQIQDEIQVLINETYKLIEGKFIKN